MSEEAKVTLSYTISDGKGGTDTASVEVTVNGVNDDPEADDSNQVTEDAVETASGNVLANDSDIDNGDTFSVTSIAFGATAGTVGSALKGAYGTLALNSDGSYSYVAEGDLIDTLASSQTDVFTYTITDGNGGTDTATLTIDVILADDHVTTNGTGIADTIYGDQKGKAGAEDTINGLNGNDRLYGLDGADTLKGGAGSDMLYGGNGWDSLFGDSGNDTLDGGAGKDMLNGGSGNDVLLGGAGDDVLTAGSGNDRMTGGEGFDKFLMTSSGGTQTITDFVVGTDLLELSGVTFKSLRTLDLNGDGVQDTFVSLSSGSAVLLGVSGRITPEQLFELPPPPPPPIEANVHILV